MNYNGAELVVDEEGEGDGSGVDVGGGAFLSSLSSGAGVEQQQQDQMRALLSALLLDGGSGKGEVEAQVWGLMLGEFREACFCVCVNIIVVLYYWWRGGGDSLSDICVCVYCVTCLYLYA